MNISTMSVIIPTHNRSNLLRKSLESLSRQTLDRDLFEVVVVDDGSTDDTRCVCKEIASDFDLKYVYLTKAGNASAKNAGIFASKSPILFFFDDDDVADPKLLAEHLRVHEANPEPEVAVLGY